MDKKEIRYGIVGIGKQGTFYTKIFTKLSGLVKGAKLTAVCDILPERRKYAEENLKGVKVFDNYQDMFASGLIDVVMVETPHYFHPQIAIDAMKAGLNVLCDKPAGVYTKQVREMNEEAKSIRNCFWNDVQSAHESVVHKSQRDYRQRTSRKLTRIVWIITNWYRPRAYYAQGGWRGTWWGEGGGVLLNQCPHQLDLFTWLAGLPVSVTATASTVGRDISVENDVTAYCKFANGATGVFITSTHDAPGTNRLEITGEGGKIVIENGKLVFTENEEMEPAFRNITPCLWASRKQKIQVSRNRALSCRHEISASARRHNQKLYRLSSQKTDKFTAPGEQGIVGLTFSNAIHLASWTHKEVRIPFDEDLYISELEKRKEAEKENGKNNQNTQKRELL